MSSSGVQQCEGRAVVSSGSRGGESSAEPLDEGKKLSGPLAEGAQAGGNEKGTPSRERDGPAFPDVGTKCGLREVMQVTQDHTARSSNASRDYTITLTPGDTGGPKGPVPSCWVGFLPLAVLVGMHLGHSEHYSIALRLMSFYIQNKPW